MVLKINDYVDYLYAAMNRCLPSKYLLTFVVHSKHLNPKKTTRYIEHNDITQYGKTLSTEIAQNSNTIRMIITKITITTY